MTGRKFPLSGIVLIVRIPPDHQEISGGINNSSNYNLMFSSTH
jgi:hypothetical protein